jgi:CO/xanthine dehydrogenase FAD-binding subunit
MERARAVSEDDVLSQPLYLQPASLEEAVAALAARRLTVLAGATDFYPARVGKPLREDVLDITRVTALRGVCQAADGWRIGALTTWTDLLRQPLPSLFDALKAAAREIGGVQIQNAGTIAGNLCHASPAADGVPVLLALDAEVELSSVRGVRRMPLAQFVLGPRRTACQPDELLTAVCIRPRGASSRSAFLKLGARRYLVISVVMVAAVVEADANGCIGHAAVAVGACSPVAQRLPGLERRLLGAPMRSIAALPQAADLAALTPITDVRGTAAYRLDAALTLLRRVLGELGR